MAKEQGFPHPTDEQIILITNMYNQSSNQFSDNHMEKLYEILTLEVDSILESIRNENIEDYGFYKKYFETFPMLYFGIVPRHIIKKRLAEKYSQKDYDITPIAEVIFETLPDPLTIQNSMYDYLKKDMEVYHKIYIYLKKLPEREKFYKFILDPVTFLGTESLSLTDIGVTETKVSNLNEMIRSVISQQFT